MSLDIVILTLNEEINLERCIASVSGWTESVHIVDSGSTDNTVEAGRRLGALVHVNKQLGPFDIAAQRNWALDNCDLLATWVLYLDADEVVTPQLRAVLEQTMADPSAHDAYNVATKYLFRGQWMKRCHGYPNYHGRLLQRGQARFDGGVFEHFVGTDDVGTIHEPYLHYGNSKGFADWLERHDRYSTWEANTAVAYLESGDVKDFKTVRKTRLREVAARLWPLRPLARFFIMYVVRLGFLDGRQALPFCLRYTMYEFMISEKIAEARALAAGRPL